MMLNVPTPHGRGDAFPPVRIGGQSHQRVVNLQNFPCKYPPRSASENRSIAYRNVVRGSRA